MWKGGQTNIWNSRSYVAGWASALRDAWAFRSFALTMDPVNFTQTFNSYAMMAGSIEGMHL